jgi:hypothetical protein
MDILDRDDLMELVCLVDNAVDRAAGERANHLKILKWRLFAMMVKLEESKVQDPNCDDGSNFPRSMIE